LISRVAKSLRMSPVQQYQEYGDLTYVYQCEEVTAASNS